MKKKLLFVIPGLDAGGGEKSLINLLNEINYDEYEVDLFLFSHKGLFIDLVPNDVNIIPLPKVYKAFTLPLFKSIITLGMIGKFNLIRNRISFSVINRLRESISKREQHSWRRINKAFEGIENQYDAAVGFLEKTSIYFVVDKVKATKKVGWIHNDYDKLEADKEFDKKYFEKLDNIITVSEECSKVLKRVFPQESEKIKVIYNISSKSIIEKLSLEKTSEKIRTEKEFIILTIGRLHEQKGYDIAIEACEYLVNKGYSIKWYVIGEGEERKKIEKSVIKRSLSSNFILLGLRSNPYPYIRQADFYVQTSRYEGKSIAIDEAKILCKPIVVTNFSTATDQIESGVDGIITDMNGASVGRSIEKLINDDFLRGYLESNLKSQHESNDRIINDIYSLFN